MCKKTHLKAAKKSLAHALVTSEMRVHASGAMWIKVLESCSGCTCKDVARRRKVSCALSCCKLKLRTVSWWFGFRGEMLIMNHTVPHT